MSVCDEFRTGHFRIPTSSLLYSLSEGPALTKRTFRLTSVRAHSQFHFFKIMIYLSLENQHRVLLTHDSDAMLSTFCGFNFFCGHLTVL